MGLDDFGQFVMGSIIEVLLPDVEQRVKVDESFMSLRCDDGAADLPSPIDGTVVGVNRAVYLDSSLIKLDPYGDGWLAEIEPSGQSVLLTGARRSCSRRHNPALDRKGGMQAPSDCGGRNREYGCRWWRDMERVAG